MTCQPQSSVGTDTALAVENLRRAIDGNIERLGESAGRQTKLFQFVSQMLAGMDRRQLALGDRTVLNRRRYWRLTSYKQERTARDMPRQS